MKNLLKIASISTLAAVFPAVSQADSAILSSLKSQGIQTVAMDTQRLSETKGAARITGQPMPSVTVGLKTYQVTWNKQGSQTDYRSYLSVSNEYDPWARQTHTDQGVVYQVAGNRWLADKISNVGSWSLANATQVDVHLQALDNATGNPLNFGFRTTSWNRPVSTFKW
jgi:hypothetical protein